MAKFPVILCDPPWAYKVWAEPKDQAGNRNAAFHYPTQSIEWLASLPVADIANKDAVLLIWVTFPVMPDALRVIKSWGFTYKTVAFTWIKTTQAGHPRMGLGYWTRANAEVCLLATRGNPKRLSKSVHQVIMAPVKRHSEKPFEQFERIEQLLEGPYLEIFARQNTLFGIRPHWTRLGNEVQNGMDIRCALRQLAQHGTGGDE